RTRPTASRLDRPREDGNRARGPSPQMPVEHHRPIADEKPAAGADRNRRIVDCDEAVGDRALIELRELGREVLCELDRESRFDLAPDYAEVAHQVADAEPADVIVCVEPV